MALDWTWTLTLPLRMSEWLKTFTFMMFLTDYFWAFQFNFLELPPAVLGLTKFDESITILPFEA